MAKQKKNLTRQQKRQQARRAKKQQSIPQEKPSPSSNILRNRWFILGIVGLFLLPIAWHLYNSYSDQTPVKEPIFRHDGKLSLITSDSSYRTEIDIEIVESQEEIMQGLMYRKSMEETQGMLFDMPVEEPQSFWMKNTYIPLDIVYINGFGEIVSIQANTTPLSTKSLPSDLPAKYVLEVNAGFMKRNGYGEGDKIIFTKFKN